MKTNEERKPKKPKPKVGRPKGGTMTQDIKKFLTQKKLEIKETKLKSSATVHSDTHLPNSYSKPTHISEGENLTEQKPNQIPGNNDAASGTRNCM